MNVQELYQSTDAFLEALGYEEKSLISILQEIQEKYSYLPREVFPYLSKKMGLSEATIYGVATFYENFSLEAKGKYVIKVCDGTACHVRKSQPIYDAIRAHLGLEGKQKTSADGLFTLETVSCLGACGLAPVMMIGEDVFGRLTPDQVPGILDKFRA